MVVWFAHVRVGHRQLSILDKALNANALGAFLCVYLLFLMIYAENPI